MSSPAPVLVTGASGFIGSRLCQALVEAGHRVRAMTRRPADYTGAGEPVGADVHDPASLEPALSGAGTAYYLVHSLASPDFERLDAQAAQAFAAAAAQAGVRRIIYLGGLGADDGELSPHLRSRRTVESLLGSTGVPVTALRAAVVIGHGGISWEITRQLVDHLPAMLVPSWVNTRSQPIALADVIGYLVGVLDDPATDSVVYEIG
ncbi:MAG TPA: NAD(P)H-binding protein, partial [Jatrophihabitans sp.]|nr:NAD(P)H-binding protein [Jatrophihabitans sp.]